MSKCDDTSPFFCSSLMPTSQKEIPAALHNLRAVWNKQILYKKGVKPSRITPIQNPNKIIILTLQSEEYSIPDKAILLFSK